MNFKIEYLLINNVTGYYDNYTYIFTSNLRKRTLQKIYNAQRWINLRHVDFERQVFDMVNYHKVGYQIEIKIIDKNIQQSKYIVSKKNKEYMKSISFSF